MLQYERLRSQAGSSLIRDIVRHPAEVGGQCKEVLQQAGFSLCEAQSSGETEDCDGIPHPPLCAPVREGGDFQFLQLRGRAALCLELWSIDEETGSKVCFIGAHDISRGILYMKMSAGGFEDLQGLERPTKSAMTSLLDIADACRAKKLTIGLGVEHAGSADFLCSLLYLGFQVVPSRKSPLTNCALLLDLDIGWPSADNYFSSTDGHGTCTGTSDCSTSAEDEALRCGINESDFSSAE